LRTAWTPFRTNPHSAPSSNIKDHPMKFPKHSELFADDYYDDVHRQGEDGGVKNPKERPNDPF
jgi:hypothetical protein